MDLQGYSLAEPAPFPPIARASRKVIGESLQKLAEAACPAYGNPCVSAQDWALKSLAGD